MAFGLQPLVQQQQLRAFARPVDALDDDQASGQTVRPLTLPYTGERPPRLSGKFLLQILINTIPILTVIKLNVKRQIIRIEFVQSMQLNFRPVDLQDTSPKKGSGQLRQKPYKAAYVMMARSPGVAPGYMDLESMRSPVDPLPADSCPESPDCS